MTMTYGHGDSTSKTLYARVNDQIRGGLNVGHLRVFLEQADKAGLTNDVPVKITDELASEGAARHVSIRAERTVKL